MNCTTPWPLLPLRSPHPSRAQAESPRRGLRADVGAERSASSGVGDLVDASAHDSLILVQEQLPRPLAGMASYACAVVRLRLASTCRRRSDLARLRGEVRLIHIETK
jgi:hypothetical protein